MSVSRKVTSARRHGTPATMNDDAHSTQTVTVIFTQKFPTGQPNTQQNPAAANAINIQNLLSVCFTMFLTYTSTPPSRKDASEKIKGVAGNEVILHVSG